MFADGLTDWMRGSDTLGSEAAARNVAEVVTLVANAHTDNKWSSP